MSVNISKWVLGVIAIVVGLLCFFWYSGLQYLIGAFLIIWGIITLIGKKD